MRTILWMGSMLLFLASIIVCPVAQAKVCRDAEFFETIQASVALGYPVDIDRAVSLVPDVCNINWQSPHESSLLDQVADLYVQAFAKSGPGSISVDVPADVAPKVLDLSLLILERDPEVKVGGDGLSALDYLVTYGKEQSVEPLFNLILANKKLNVDQTNRFGTVLSRLLTKGWSLKAIDAVLNRSKNLVRLIGTRSPYTGKTPIHEAASRIQVAGEPLLIQYLLERLPMKNRVNVANLKTEAGRTALMTAISAKNILAAKYLIALPGLDINAVHENGQNALFLANTGGLTEIANLLIERGSVASKTPSAKENVCDQRNMGDLDFDRLLAINETCAGKFNSHREFLRLLPYSFVTTQLQFYRGFGLQVASPEMPRALMVSPTGTFFLTAGGIDHAKSNAVLEMLRFDVKSRKYELREASYDPLSKKMVLSDANPSRCLACHGDKDDPLPVWGNWRLQPGAYLGDHESFYSYGKKLLRRTQKAATSEDALQRDIPVHIGQVLPINVDGFFDRGLGQRSARLLSQESALRPFRYAILGTLMCNQPALDFLPENVKVKLEAIHTWTSVHDDLRKSLKQELVDRINQQREADPQSPKHDSVFGILKRTDDYSYSFDFPRLVGLRYIVDGVAGNHSLAKHFTSSRVASRPYYNAYNLSVLERLVWRDLLDREKDSDLYQKLDSLAGTSDPLAGMPFLWEQSGRAPDLQKEPCEILRNQSLKELSELSN